MLEIFLFLKQPLSNCNPFTNALIQSNNFIFLFFFSFHARSGVWSLLSRTDQIIALSRLIGLNATAATAAAAVAASVSTSASSTPTPSITSNNSSVASKRKNSKSPKHERNDLNMIKPFICTCGKSYLASTSLKAHQKWECGKDPSFQCPYCPYKSKQKSNMRTHVRTVHLVVNK